ncbi:hypothetical protein [Marinoscillum furvescens]|uniref:hypothetical protein n=1 Tax=Marinoscillum furvescens TaxID=1026 RepID=UPI001C878BCA|nr:hypothetical protein [Marinoscillum furvescens]
MRHHVDKIDRILRLLFSVFLLWLGLVELNGLSGDLVGIGFASIATMPLYLFVART